MAFTSISVSLNSRNSISWLEKKQTESSYHLNSSMTQVKLISGDGFSVSLPLPLLLASSALLKSVLSSHHCCGGVDISLPSVTGGTLLLVAEIIKRGETTCLDGTVNSRESLKEMEQVLGLLLCNASVEVAKVNVSMLSEILVENGESQAEVAEETNCLIDCNSNAISSQAPSTPSQKSSSPPHSVSSAITLSPSDVKQEKEPVLYIDVNVIAESTSISPKQEVENFLPSNKIKEENDDCCEVPLCCPICQNQRIFRTDKSLMQHIQLLHPEPEFACTKCDKTFVKKNSLIKHTKLVHMKLQCKFCALGFISKLKLHQHVQSKHADFDCPKCEEKFTSKEKLEDHKKHVHERFNCDDCQVRANSPEVLMKHIKIKHKDVRFSCNVCHKIFKSKESFLKHCESVGHDPKSVTKFKMPNYTTLSS